jgi:hypothetical protein
MSIISCTSPRPSCRILPASSETSRPSSALRGPKLLAEQADEFAAARRRGVAPGGEGGRGGGDHRLHLALGVFLQTGEFGAVDGRADGEGAAGEGGGVEGRRRRERLGGLIGLSSRRPGRACLRRHGTRRGPASCVIAVVLHPPGGRRATKKGGPAGLKGVGRAEFWEEPSRRRRSTTRRRRKRRAGRGSLATGTYSPPFPDHGGTRRGERRQLWTSGRTAERRPGTCDVPAFAPRPVSARLAAARTRPPGRPHTGGAFQDDIDADRADPPRRARRSRPPRGGGRRRRAGRRRREADQGGGDLHGAGRAAVGEPHPPGAEGGRGARRRHLHVLGKRRQHRL